MGDESRKPEYPQQLLGWAGNRSGGVRRLFDSESGRPGDAVFKTNLLVRLEDWAGKFARREEGTPRIILLVGGPGNGKTEAIESTVEWLDRALGADGAMKEELRHSFMPAQGLPVPRMVSVEAGRLAAAKSPIRLSIVQDATTIAGAANGTAARLLLDELASVLAAPKSEAYLCCVNRGVLDDALIDAIELGRDNGRELLEEVTRAVSLAADSPPCWPLAGFPEIAVWPMDAESLLTDLENGDQPPAREIFQRAIAEGKWAEPGACVAGAQCPFCSSRAVLAREREGASLLQILRWFEVASGRRWSFRDMFSLVSYLLAGHQADKGAVDPCAWAKKQATLDEQARRGAKPSKDSSTALYRLVSAQYQHAVFHRWDRDVAATLLRHLKELDLGEDNTAMGLCWFLSSRRTSYLPAMIAPLLEGIGELLDPALVDPDTTAVASQKTKVWLRDIDASFSHSVGDGLDRVKKLQLVPRLEMELIERLAKLDAHLSVPAVRRKRPAVANNVQRLVRDFACRLVRRTIGARLGLVRDAAILADYQQVVETGEGDKLFDVAREVERLLNSNQDFEIPLTTTFGQPLPPASKRATLVVPARAVHPLEMRPVNRPRSPIVFLRVGSGRSMQPIALTYELFKAVRELQRGLSMASLPLAVLALLDATRARLSGPIVRDREILDRARIRLGSSGLSIEQRRSGFVASKGRADK